jgi:tetratricopeptide (TPR) repeat protein
MDANRAKEMTHPVAPANPSDRLKRMLGFLERDPNNLALIGDAASTAFDERAFDIASELLARHARLRSLPPALMNLKGLLDIAQSNYSEAATTFETLRAQGHDDAAVKFNLAWAKAMAGAYEEAAELLDGEVLTASPRAPALMIRMLHHLERYDDALAKGEELAKVYPGNQALMGALATLAMDAEKPELARAYAERAGDNPEGRAALGFLTLGEHDTDKALEMFSQVSEVQPGNPRAWVGKGLALLVSGDTAAATEALDRGAELFKDHLGSWIASGWVHFVQKDYKGARASFERAMAIDPNFSETHGGLAVLDIVAGNVDSARKRTETALRLDKMSFGGALAKSMLLERSGHGKAAQKVFEAGLNTPVGIKGETIAQAIAAFGYKGPKRK